jgi:hypothetical protein
MARDSGGADRRYSGMRAIAATLPRVAGTVLRRRGFAEPRVVTDWAAIIGPELARETMPERLTFAKGAQDGGVLRIRAAGPLALELQHLEPLVIERINGYFGYRAVAKLAFVQAPAAPLRRPRPGPGDAPLDAGAEARLDGMLAGVEDEALRASLARLGRAILAVPARAAPGRTG